MNRGRRPPSVCTPRTFRFAQQLLPPVRQAKQFPQFMYGSTEQRSPGLDVGDARADCEHLDAQLVAGNARVAEERHLAEIAADVGAADADAMHANQRLARARARGVLNRPIEVAGFFKTNCFHESIIRQCLLRYRLSASQVAQRLRSYAG